MLSRIRSAGTFVVLSMAASAAPAQTFCSPVFHVPLPQAPDARGPGFYAACPNGGLYGPNYCLRPPTEPFQGPMFLVGQNQNMGQGNMGSFPSHPYVRGPRDFFMWRENMEDQMRREQRPVLIP